MTRQHPFSSPVGCLAALVLFGGVALVVWFTGGQAFSPGPVTAKSQEGQALAGFKSHADFERDCEQCHTPPGNHYSGACRNCHSDTGNWRNATFSHPWFNIYYEGTNGACANCHPGNNYAVTDCQTCHAQNGEGNEGEGSGEGGRGEGGKKEDDD